MKDHRHIDRRQFIKELSLIGFGMAVGSTMFNMGVRGSLAQPVSRIVIARHQNAVSGVKINRDAVKAMVERGIMQYTGQASVADAWASIFPKISQNDIVSIKVNCINWQSLPTHPEVVDAIVEGLISAGFKENNIIIWDRTNWELRNSGYKLNTNDTGVRCFGSDEPGWGYEKQVRIVNQNVRLSKILTISDHIINVPLLKDHGIAGVTISMKNHYGSVDNPGSLHGGQCDPYIAELNNVPEIKEKTRMIVVDGLMGIYIGGPMGAPQFVYNGVIFGQDPVAVDYQGWKILESERQKRGMALPEPRHIATAAKIGLGTNDPNNIKVETVDIEDQFSVNTRNKIRLTWSKVKISS